MERRKFIGATASAASAARGICADSHAAARLRRIKGTRDMNLFLRLSRDSLSGEATHDLQSQVKQRELALTSIRRRPPATISPTWRKVAPAGVALSAAGAPGKPGKPRAQPRVVFSPTALGS